MAGTERLDLFSNSAAGNSTPQFWKGGKFFFYGDATFGSLKLQHQNPQGTWMDVSGSTLVATGYVSLELPPGQVRAVGTGGSAYYAQMVAIPTTTMR